MVDLIVAIVFIAVSSIAWIAHKKGWITPQKLDFADKWGSIGGFALALVLLALRAFNGPVFDSIVLVTATATPTITATSQPTQAPVQGGNTANNNSGIVQQGSGNVLNVNPVPTATFSPTPTITPTPTATPLAMNQVIVVKAEKQLPGSVCGYGKQHALVRDQAGVLYIFLSNDTKKGVVFESISKDNGVTWSDPQAITAWKAPDGQELPGLSCSAAVDLTGIIHLAVDLTAVDIITMEKETGQWNEPKHRGYGTSNFGPYAADLAIGPTGQVMIAWSSRQVWEIHTNAKGGWSGEKPLSEGAWHPAVFIDAQNRAHIVFNTGNETSAADQPSGTNTYYLTSDNWEDWPKEKIVNPITRHWTGDANLVVDPKGEIHVTYVQKSELEGDLYYVHSHDGIYWTVEPVKLNPFPGVQTGTVGSESAAMVLDSWGNLYVVWKGLDNSTPKKVYHVYVRQLDINRNIWSDPIDLGTACDSVGCHPTVVYHYLDKPSGKFDLDVAWTDVGGVRYVRATFSVGR